MAADKIPPASGHPPLKKAGWGGFLIFFVTFALYLHTAGPTVVPYRDAGEMATSVTRLGVLHPPGYPVYSILGHLATCLPLANPAYRLNLFSALMMALAWAFLFLLGAEFWGIAASLLTVLLGAVSFQFWTHALVSEMYTLHLVFLTGILGLLYRRKLEAAAFLFGLGLGARLDLLLCAPAAGILFFFQMRSDERWSRAGRLVLWGLLGFSVYGYLYIRAQGHPLLNWGDPSTLERFLASLARRSYGGGLDLLSRSYSAGENFWPEFSLYLRHVSRDFSLLSWPLAAGGLAVTWKKNRMWFAAILSGWLFTGPVFVYLGNLPVNPHAVAIMEAAYLVPDLFLLLSVGFGLSALRRYLGVFCVVEGLLAVLILAQAARFYPIVSKRHNWVADDFIHNTYYSAPEPSVIVARSDVPIFLLYYGHWIRPGFPWRVPIAQGLAGSAWYKVMMERQVRQLDVEALITAEDWEAFEKANPGWSLFGTTDTDWPEAIYPRLVPSGLLLQLLPRGKASVFASDTLLNDLYVYRGRYRYDAYHEFFTPELVEEYAKAWMEWGRLLSRGGGNTETIGAYLHALSIKPDMPYAAFQLGYYYFQRNDLKKADFYYRWCVDNFRIMHRQAEEWKSLPNVRHGLSRDEAQAIAHWGVIQERLGNPDQAITLYHRALDVDPGSADARYNLAVIYWRAGRWKDVVDQLQALSAAHPEDARWRAYLPKALEKLQKGG
jgi:tetratricopeptide (TPR) repeat protein